MIRSGRIAYNGGMICAYELENASNSEFSVPSNAAILCLCSYLFVDIRNDRTTPEEQRFSL